MIWFSRFIPRPSGLPEGRFILPYFLLTTYFFRRMIVFTGVDEGFGSFGAGEKFSKCLPTRRKLGWNLA